MGIEAFPGRELSDMVLWIESKSAVISGDTLKDVGQGLEISVGWLREGVTREHVAEGLRPLLALPVEHVLGTHGGPTGPPSSARALLTSQPRSLRGQAESSQFGHAFDDPRRVARPTLFR